MDDIVIQDGVCQESTVCDFETDDCGWENVKLIDQSDWLRNHGPTSSRYRRCFLVVVVVAVVVVVVVFVVVVVVLVVFVVVVVVVVVAAVFVVFIVVVFEILSLK